MANVTITLDDDLLKRARVRAAEEGTSVNAVIRQHLRHWTGSGRTKAASSLVRRSEVARSRSGGSRWSRDDLHGR